MLYQQDGIAQFSTADFKFKTYTTQEGLVHNFTLKCRMDSKGFLWVITQNGLSRFDGYQFTNFQNKPDDSTSLPFNELTDIAIDAADRIWLAYDKGLCYYDQSKHSFIKLKQTAVSLCYDSINSKIWFNNYEGLFAINLKNLTIEPSTLQIKYPNKPLITNIDSRQRIWISLINGYGYYVYDVRANTYGYFKSPFWIRNVKNDNEGNTWICTWWNDLQKYDENGMGKRNTVYKLPRKSTIQLIFQDITQSIPLTGPDIIWVALHTGGIALLNKKENRFVQWIQYDPSLKSGIATDFNSSIYTDPNGIVWICTWKGLTKVNRQEQQFQSSELKFLQSDGYNLLTSIIDDPYKKEFAWIGVNGTGVCYYDKVNQKPVKWYYSTKEGYTDLLGNWIWVANGIKDRQKKLWFITYGGFVKVDHGIVSKVPLTIEGHPASASTARMLADGNIWISNDYGLMVFDPVSERYRFYKRHNNVTNSNTHFFDVIDLNENEICCASTEGLVKFNKRSETFSLIAVSQADPLKKEWNDFIVLEKIGNLIYAGSTSGLLQYDIESGKTTVLGREQQIFHLLRHSLLKDRSGNLWIYTLHGLFKYNPAKNEFKKFTAADGIYDNLSDPVQMFYYNDNIYIGYRMAYTRFIPNQVDVNNIMVKPGITAISINNRLIKIPTENFSDSTLSLSSADNNIEFDYTAPDYTNSEKITFAYMLEGFDKDWVLAGIERKINYSNLKGGNYTFKLKACNSSGLWNEKYTSFKFYIKPPVWQRWWFWPSLALLFIAVVVFIAGKRIDMIRKKEKQKTAVNKMMAELENKMLRSQMNPHFIFNSLNSVQKYIWENKEEDAAEYLASFAKLIRAILENSRKETISLKEEIEVIKLYIELEHRRSNAHFDYTIKVNEKLAQDKIQIPPLLMQPFIENAIWHGLNKKPTKGTLAVSVLERDKKLVCIIDDDGVGRQQKKEGDQPEKRSLGIEITEQRISRLMETTNQAASVIIEDKKENGTATGTRVTITLPLQTQ